ncbi:MAG: hypothetical protein ACLVLH_26000 [Eisenbergiella massiliensis]
MAYQIFEMSDGQRVALYAQGNSVLYCLLPFARGMLPIEVKRDYLAHFEARVFRDTVCYVYENLEHTIILDTLGNGPARIILTDGPLGYGFCNLHLVVRDGVCICSTRLSEGKGVWTLRMHAVSGELPGSGL